MVKGRFSIHLLTMGSSRLIAVSLLIVTVVTSTVFADYPVLPNFVFKEWKSLDKEEGAQFKWRCAVFLNKMDPTETVRNIQWWRYKEDGYPELVTDGMDGRIRLTTFDNTARRTKGLTLTINSVEKSDDRDYLCVIGTNVAQYPTYLRLKVNPTSYASAEFSGPYSANDEFHS